MAILQTAFICDTSLFVGKEENNAGVAFRYGFKDKNSTVDSYGGVSNNIIKTGDIPSECQIFIFDCGTGVLADAEEGGRIVLVEDVTVVPQVEVVPFETIYMSIVQVRNYVLKFDRDGTQYKLIDARDKQNNLALDKAGAESADPSVHEKPVELVLDSPYLMILPKVASTNHLKDLNENYTSLTLE